jgi:hypothetical protein
MTEEFYITNNDSNTPMFYAFEQGNFELVNIL